MNMPLDARRLQHETARYLPQPLYILYVQVSAYNEACDPHLEVKILGDLDIAKAAMEAKSVVTGLCSSKGTGAVWKMPNLLLFLAWFCRVNERIFTLLQMSTVIQIRKTLRDTKGCVKYQTWKTAYDHISKTICWVLLTNFEVFGNYVVKQCHECLIYLLNQN